MWRYLLKKRHTIISNGMEPYIQKPTQVMSYKHPQSNNLEISAYQSTSSHSLINRDNHSFVFFTACTVTVGLMTSIALLFYCVIIFCFYAILLLLLSSVRRRCDHESALSGVCLSNIQLQSVVLKCLVYQSAAWGRLYWVLSWNKHTGRVGQRGCNTLKEAWQSWPLVRTKHWGCFLKKNEAYFEDL